VRVKLQADGGVLVNGAGAARVPLQARTAAFTDGSVKLDGRLLLPPGKGPFPAVVIVPGAERAYWNSYDLWADFFASRGFAVLTYDKRGVGASGGRYLRAATSANLADQAHDALAGLAWLKHQASIDTNHIGLSGGSQAGWVIVLAAAESTDVRFAAFQSGPAMSVGRQVAYDSVTQAGARQPPPTAQQIHTAIDGVPTRGFDPQPLLAKLQIPMLWQLGSVDKRMYTPETVSDLQTIEETGTHDLTVRVYNGGAHSLRLTRHGLISEEKTSPGFVPQVFPDLGAWLAAHD
jgi:dienelactone hydrolase